jgi:hypothetical protein
MAGILSVSLALRGEMNEGILETGGSETLPTKAGKIWVLLWQRDSWLRSE